MRPAVTLTGLFAVLAVTTLVLGVLGAFSSAPGVWPEGWPIVVIIHTLLAALFGYYTAKTK